MIPNGFALISTYSPGVMRSGVSLHLFDPTAANGGVQSTGACADWRKGGRDIDVRPFFGESA